MNTTHAVSLKHGLLSLLLLIFVQRTNAQYQFNNADFCQNVSWNPTSGLNGYHLSGYFPDCPAGQDCRNILSDLAPQVLRFPSGGTCKYMHFFDASGNLLVNDPYIAGDYAGYGYKLSEIAQFIDCYSSDPVITPSWLVSEAAATGCSTATIEAGPYSPAQKEALEEYCDWSNKVTQNGLETTNFLVDFADMVTSLQAASGTTIDILFVANIITGTDQELKNALEYLVETRGLNVKGVEMGSETYALDFAFTNFSNYYSYIQGGPSSFSCCPVNHNYVGKIRSNDNSTIRAINIGLCGAPAGINYTDYFSNVKDLYSSGKDTKYNSWNTDLGNKWNDALGTYTIEGTATVINLPRFDAFIIHPYYESKFWETILSMAPAFNSTSFTAAGGAINYLTDDASGNLYQTFERAVQEFTYFGKTGFKTQLMDGYYASKFWLKSNPTNQKRVWLTEMNLLNGENGGAGGSADKSIFYNTFVQSLYWYMLKQSLVQINLDRCYTNGGPIQFAILHNTSGENTGFVSSSFKRKNDVAGTPTFENLTYKINGDPGADAVNEGDDYDVVKRMEFYAGGTFNDFRNPLQFIPHTTVSPYATDPTLDVRLYVNTAKTYAYVYFANWKPSTSTYTTIPIRFTDLVIYDRIPKNKYIVSPSAMCTAKYFSCDKLYSTAGYSQLHDFRSSYYGDDYGNYAEYINAANFNTPAMVSAATTFYVPTNSMGVVIVPLTLVTGVASGSCGAAPVCSWKEGNAGNIPVITASVSVYPNPFNNSTKFEIDYAMSDDRNYSIRIYNVYGQVADVISNIRNTTVEYQNMLPAGYYLFEVLENEKRIAAGKLIKAN